MSTFKQIERFEKIKKLILILTVVLAILDTVIAFINPAYLSSMTSLIGLGFGVYSVVKEYADFRTRRKEMSRMILILSLILSGFSLNHILLNLVNMSGTLA